MRCFFFGCWNEPGHYLVGPGRAIVRDDAIVYYGPGRTHLDASLAPRRRLDDGRLCWSGQGSIPDDRRRIEYKSSECPEGQFLLHVLDNGFTAIQWWDRQQGDKRGACNSTVLLEGKHTSEEMLAAARQHFPHVLENLTKAGISLVEVFPGV